MCAGLANLAITIQLGWREVTTARVPFTHPPSMLILRLRTTRAPTLRTNLSAHDTYQLFACRPLLVGDHGGLCPRLHTLSFPSILLTLYM